jgi:histidyl-tRNA synthetase
MGLEEFLDFDLTIVRGIAYYTGTVFELFDAKRELRAICGGGRYDNLLSSLGGVDLPAVDSGWGTWSWASCSRIGDSRHRCRRRSTCSSRGSPNKISPTSFASPHELRDGGIRVEYVLSLQPIGKQLKTRRRREARFAVLIGPMTGPKGEVVIKDLRTKEQASSRRHPWPRN